MKSIRNFLSRFKDIKAPDKAVEYEVKKFIGNIFSENADGVEVSFKKPNLIIKSNNQVLKNEIFIRKEEILEKINKEINFKQNINIFFK
ncbi:hypothetical protein ACFLZC_01440 [Patescibacteria group bacterium]